MCLDGLCSHVVVLGLCEVVLVSYVDAVTDACTVVFVCMLRECEDNSNAGVGDGRCVWGECRA